MIGVATALNFLLKLQIAHQSLVKKGECRPKIISWNIFLSQPTSLRPGDVDQSSVTMGAPIRAPKQVGAYWELRRQGRPIQFWVRQKSSPTNLLSKTLHDISKFQHLCSERHSKRFVTKFFSDCPILFDQILVSSDCMILCFPYFSLLFLPFFMTIYSLTPFTVRHHLQSDTRGIHGRPRRPLIYAPVQHHCSIQNP